MAASSAAYKATNVASSSASQQASSDAANATNAAEATMSIGAVIKELSTEFPDVAISKIRFLESEGLISPSRSSSGYRRFSPADVQRLRYILTVQRDNYLPLKVIKEQLEAMDAGGSNELASVTPLVTADQFRETDVVSLDRDELASRVGADSQFITELIRAKLIKPDTMDRFGSDDVMICEAATKLREFGLDARHLKTVLMAANREADLVGQAAVPMSKSRATSAHQKAEEMAREMTALIVTMHGALVKRQVNRNLGS